MKSIFLFFKREMMFTISLAVSLLSFLITKPDIQLIKSIEWRTLATLFMLLLVLEGFKSENLFLPLLKISFGIKKIFPLVFFLVFSVFFSSMFVTNDVSLIIFVPLTIIILKSVNMDKYTVPVLVFENIAAVRGSLLTPFGSPQNLFLYTKSGLAATDFIKMMFPLFLFSFVLLNIFIFFTVRRDLKNTLVAQSSFAAEEWSHDRKWQRKIYFFLFALVIFVIVSRFKYYYFALFFIISVLFFADRAVFKRVDYILILTFLCFFVFSSSVSRNERIAAFFSKAVSGREYIWSLVISQFISNVPASIVLWPFTENLRALIYGLDTAGLLAIIGSLASVITLRLYTKSTGNGSRSFMMKFELYSVLFFLIVNPFQIFLLEYF